MAKTKNPFLQVPAVCFGVFVLLSGCAKTTDTLLNEGREFDSGKRYEDAIEIYDQILAREPDNIEALLGRAIDKGLTMNDQGAIDDLHQVLGLDSTNALALYNLGIAFGNMARYAESINAFNEAAKTAAGKFVTMEYVLKDMEHDETHSYDVPITDIAFERGIVHYKADSVRKAYLDFTYCIERDFNLGGSYYYRGRTYLKASMLPQACEDLRMALMYGEKEANEIISRYCK